MASPPRDRDEDGNHLTVVRFVVVLDPTTLPRSFTARLRFLDHRDAFEAATGHFFLIRRSRTAMAYNNLRHRRLQERAQPLGTERQRRSAEGDGGQIPRSFGRHYYCYYECAYCQAWFRYLLRRRTEYPYWYICTDQQSTPACCGRAPTPPPPDVVHRRQIAEGDVRSGCESSFPDDESSDDDVSSPSSEDVEEEDGKETRTADSDEETKTDGGEDIGEGGNGFSPSELAPHTPPRERLGRAREEDVDGPSPNTRPNCRPRLNAIVADAEHEPKQDMDLSYLRTICDQDQVAEETLAPATPVGRMPRQQWPVTHPPRARRHQEEERAEPDPVQENSRSPGSLVRRQLFFGGPSRARSTGSRGHREIQVPHRRRRLFDDVDPSTDDADILPTNDQATQQQQQNPDANPSPGSASEPPLLYRIWLPESQERETPSDRPQRGRWLHVYSANREFPPPPHEFELRPLTNASGISQRELQDRSSTTRQVFSIVAVVAAVVIVRLIP